MPYDTRRKSLSLPALGVSLPKTLSRPHRSSLTKSSPTSERPSPQQPPPQKKRKQSHPSESSSPTSTPAPRTSTSSVTKNVSFAERPKIGGRRAYEDTPPTSPEPSTHHKYDTQGINDDIVVGVIEQLEKTGNRPHMIKELATVLSSVSDAVASSANPGALLSSRLAAYMKRSGWSALSPCPIDKELTAVHPRKIYYHLTTMPRQSLPADSSDLFAPPHSVGKGGKRIISPSISSASVDEDIEAAEERKREALSPSPEVDLSSHHLDGGEPSSEMDFVTPPTPGSFAHHRSSLSRAPTLQSNSSSFDHSSLSPHHRAASPPLEGDEKEFTQTASSVRMRGMSLDGALARPTIEVTSSLPIMENEEDKARLNREAVEALFGTHHPQTLAPVMGSSPLVKPVQSYVEQSKSARMSSAEEDVVMGGQESRSIMGHSGVALTWDTREPEDIQIEDLDDLFGAC